MNYAAPGLAVRGGVRLSRWPRLRIVITSVPWQSSRSVEPAVECGHYCGNEISALPLFWQ